MYRREEGTLLDYLIKNELMSKYVTRTHKDAGTAPANRYI